MRMLQYAGPNFVAGHSLLNGLIDNLDIFTNHLYIMQNA